MSSASSGGAAPAGVREVLSLAWPSVLSFLCNSLYRVNDQYWIGGLGRDAQAALGASFFVLILNFSLFFLAVAGSLSLVARATGARDPGERERVVLHAFVLGAAIAALLTSLGPWITPLVIDALGLEGAVAEHGSAYLGTIYWLCLPLAIAPIIDNVFIGMGHTRVPFLLQGVAVSLNFVLNPCLIYGWGPFEPLGMQGAAIATCASRGVAVAIGLAILRWRFQVHWLRHPKLELARLRRIARIGAPNSLSIAIYSVVYLALYGQVLSRLGTDVMAGLAIGFNVFEGVSFPVYLGVAIAGSSLIGRNLGAAREDLALEAVASTRRVSLLLGIGFSVAFLLLAPVLAPSFTDDAAVVREAVLYVRILALSQIFVALETANEKVLLGAGHTSPIFWISVPMNVARLPLAWVLALTLGFGAPGVWWAINLTSALKAWAFAAMVSSGTWRGKLD